MCDNVESDGDGDGDGTSVVKVLCGIGIGEAESARSSISLRTFRLKSLIFESLRSSNSGNKLSRNSLSPCDLSILWKVSASVPALDCNLAFLALKYSATERSATAPEFLFCFCKLCPEFFLDNNEVVDCDGCVDV